MQHWRSQLASMMRPTGGAFVTTWLTTSDGETITLPLRSGYTYDMTVNWGDGSSSQITAYDDADRVHTFATAGTQTISITGVCQAWYFNNSGDKLKFRTVEDWGTIEWHALDRAFHGCSNATAFKGAIPYSPYITSLYFTWYGCSKATSFPDVSTLTNVTDLRYTWCNCSNATSFPDVNTLTNVTSLYQTWYGCSIATSFPDVNALTKVNSLYRTWYNCSNATSFPDVNTLTNVNSLYQTWRSCSNATSFPAVSTLTKVSSLYQTWYGCSKATSFPDVNTLTNVTSLHQTWYGCSKATSFPAVSTLTNVTDLRYTWYACTGMTTLPALASASVVLRYTSSAFYNCSAVAGNAPELWNTVNFPNITSYSGCFYGCISLTNYASIPAGWK